MIPLGDGKEHKQKKGKQKETTNLSKKNPWNNEWRQPKSKLLAQEKKTPQNQVARANWQSSSIPVFFRTDLQTAWCQKTKRVGWDMRSQLGTSEIWSLCSLYKWYTSNISRPAIRVLRPTMNANLSQKCVGSCKSSFPSTTSALQSSMNSCVHAVA